MRKLIAALAGAGLVCALLAAGASARAETHFTVIGLAKSSRPSGGGVIVRDQLVSPGDRDDVVGHARIKFTPRSGHRVRARGTFTVGGGTLKVKGVFGPGSRGRILVIGGTRRWNGAAGKVKLRSAGEGAERYSFSVVQ
jgi:hypothetical protein